jgi:polyisoprenoid-binding protein YceI
VTAMHRPAGGFAVLTLALLGAVGAVPSAAGAAYTLLAARSSLTYTFTQAGARNHGRFGVYTVSFDPAAGRLEVLIQTRSLDTGDGERNALLRGRDFFDVARYPQARFDATRIVRTPAGYQALGSLTLRGVTRRVTVRFSWRPAVIGGRRVRELNGSTTLRRLDYGIGRGQWHSTTWVGNRVTVRYALVLVRR